VADRRLPWRGGLGSSPKEFRDFVEVAT